MKESRHPHPHVDPRQPRDATSPATNPPVFVWKPCRGERSFRLVVSRCESLSMPVLDVDGLCDPLYLPQQAFSPGSYYWKWFSGKRSSQLFHFDISHSAVILEVPCAEEWLQRIGPCHPRIFLRPEQIDSWRSAVKTDRADLFCSAVESAAAIVDDDHQIYDAPFLPDWNKDYAKAHATWRKIMVDARRFVKQAEVLSLAFMLTGQSRFARAAAQRMDSISRWDPHGASHIEHNDEAHMAVIWHGPVTCDRIWDEFTDEELGRVVEQFRERGRITFEHMHDRGAYGVERFDSHAGREIVFLAMIALVFHEQISEARRWLDWLRPILCGVWPVWAGDDGAWAEGPAYGLWYVQIMTMFASALKYGAGVDLYQRPFWKNHALWRKYVLPPYAEWIGFGDHSEPSAEVWLANANLVDLIARETGSLEFEEYVAQMRHIAASRLRSNDRKIPEIAGELYFAGVAHTAGGATPKGDTDTSADTSGQADAREDTVARFFPQTGWAAVRTDLSDASRDTALIFRSSPYGAISHSHANNNDFVIHAGGRVLAMPSGYYLGYGSAHHVHWVWHTKSHNCITLSDASQIMRSHDSRGALEDAFEDVRVVFWRGNADDSYRTHASRCRRHVIYIKRANVFVLVDEFAALPGIESSVQWNVHSFAPFTIDEAARSFSVERSQPDEKAHLAHDTGHSARLEGHFLYSNNAFFSLSSGWDPPPSPSLLRPQHREQYNLRFTPAGLYRMMYLVTLLSPAPAGAEPAKVERAVVGNIETARIGDDLVAVDPFTRLDQAKFPQELALILKGTQDALAVVLVDGFRYILTDEGLGSNT